MIWRLGNRADRVAVSLADRHYSRQHSGTGQFVPPGRCLVLVAVDGQAAWVTSWPFAQYVKHQWAGAMVNSFFRREGGDLLASEMIVQAVACTRWHWPDLPALGIVTFVKTDAIRKKRDPGRCYLRAGFHNVGMTKGGLVALQLLPHEFPKEQSPVVMQQSLFAKG